jgi:hypothetical protein
MACLFLNDIMLLPSPTVERKVIGLKARPCLAIRLPLFNLAQSTLNLSIKRMIKMLNIAHV